MKTIHTRSRSGPDGILELKVPVGVAESELAVVVIVHPLADRDGRSAARTPADRAAWERWVNELAGSIDDPTFGRHGQNDPERHKPQG